MVSVAKAIIITLLAVGTLETSLAQISNIVGGTQASHYDYPYFVSLSMGCGGTLVHQDVVVSAAHCDSTSFTVKVGPDRETVGFADKVVHPGYSSRTFENDFMVIKLDTSFPTIPVANINSNSGTPSGEQQIVVMGYGATSEGGPQSGIFREVTLNHVPYSTCNAAYDGDVDEATMFCAGVDGGGQDSCQGDSGGPLVIGNTLVGIVSWGIGCARDEYPGVNARVSAAESWIENWICCFSAAPPSGCTCDTDMGDNDGPPPTAPNVDNGSGGFCFSGDTTVHVESKGEIPMAQLQIGDKVLTSASSSSPPQWEPVYAFGHHHDNIMATFVKLFVSSGRFHDSLEMTASHMVYVHGKANPVRADSIQIGDTLVGKDNQQFTVTKLGQTTKRGIYAPLTASGNIVASNVLASNYISLQDDAPEYVHLAGTPTMLSQHDLSHLWMAPLRLLCSSSTVVAFTDVCNKTDEGGLSQWVAFGLKFAEWGNSQNIVVQVPLLIATLIFIGVFALLELAMGLPATSVLILACGGLFSYLTKGSHVNFTFGVGTRQKVP